MTDGDKGLCGRRILVIEDDYLVALMVVDLLEDAGAEVVGPIGWLEEALSFIEDDLNRFDGAVLDVNLHGKKSYPLADALAKRAIHFTFATGYGSGVLDEPYRRYPRCEKPFSQRLLVAALMHDPD
ncbi:MAG TPA: response regulator [Acidisoma sp.]|uniref:response regulator n=1 Tax=Acidisoma sp. TaxID=1872115 RepID=UPI002B58D021|nr:response regulator [Acidisoma sp.]HTI02481.1 response regulator [Acidisoma sp.]